MKIPECLALHIRKPIGRSGITMLEFFVCLGVIGILVSLLLGAVMAARESSRKLQCQNNLRQISLGLLQVIDRSKKIPSLTHLPSDIPNDEVIIVNAMVLVAKEVAIPFKASYGKVRFDQEKMGEAYPPPLFNCPSMGDRFLAFRMNLGVERTGGLISPSVSKDIFSWSSPSNLTLAEITDGLSNTVAFSERPAPIGRASVMRSIALDYASNSFLEMNENCQRAFDNGQCFVPMVPLDWWSNSIYASYYDHTLAPNASNVDCANYINPFTTELEFRIRISARSYHFGGVNVALLDGSVKFASSQIDLSTWRALGTHNAGDFVGTW